MKCKLLVGIWLLASLTQAEVPKASSSSGPTQQKGILDWIGILFGNSSTSTTTLRPHEDPPENCPPCKCGIPRTRIRIVGGLETRVLEFKWMGALMYGGKFYCGGALINDLYVLTAAHCTAGFRKERISVRFLEHDRSKPNETKTIDRNVSAIIRHLRYNPAVYDNDIALLKLDKRVDLSKALKKIKFLNSRSEDGDDESGENENGGDLEEENEDVGLRPVCLPEAKLSYTNHTGIVTGWGTTEEGGAVSSTLQEVNVPIISNEDCRKTAYKQRITDNMLCAGDMQGGRDACQGDSGGPLHVFNNDTATYHEVGVVSWGEGCARPDRPGVYARVNRYLTWIRSNTKDACYCD